MSRGYGRSEIVLLQKTNRLYRVSWVKLLVCYAKHRQLSPLDKGCAYLAGLYKPILEEEMGNLAKYALHNLDALALNRLLGGLLVLLKPC